MVCEFLQKGHVTRPTIGDEISKRLFQRFLKDLDPSKSTSSKATSTSSRSMKPNWATCSSTGDVGFAYKVYGRFLERIDQRLKLIDELVDAKHDFTVKEYLDTDTAKIDYAANDKELRERWRKRIKFDLLARDVWREAAARGRGQEEGARSLPQLRQAHEAARQLRPSGTVPVEPGRQPRSARGLHVAQHSGRFRDFDAAAAGRDRRLAARGERQHHRRGDVPGGAAAKDGRLKANDKIIAVAQGDDKFVDVVDMRLREAVKLIRGPKGTKVELKVVPAGKIEPVVYTMTRQQIEIKSQAARYEIVEHGKQADGKPYQIGVIDLPSFYAARSQSTIRRGQERQQGRPPHLERT